MSIHRRNFLTASLILSLSSLMLTAQTAAPRIGASLEVRPDSAVIQETLAYWTPERRAAAVPRDIVLDPRTFVNVDIAPAALPKAPVVVPGAAPAAAPAGLNIGARAFGENDASDPAETAALRTAAAPQIDIGETGFNYPYPYTRFNVLPDLYKQGGKLKTFPYIAIGKLFFRIGSSNYVCSASVIRPHLVVTARHCIFNYVNPSGGSFATNVVFYPGYYGGANADLGGGWVARRLLTWVANAPNYRYDIGFIQLFDNDKRGCNGSAGGRPIERYTGYLGYSYGGDYSKKQFNEFGYPAGAPFGGAVMVEAQAATGALNVLGMADTVETGSDMTGGSSGGPWLIGFAPNSGYVNGLNSYKWITPNHSNAMNSPQFHDYNFNQLLKSATGLSCP